MDYLSVVVAFEKLLRILGSNDSANEEKVLTKIIELNKEKKKVINNAKYIRRRMHSN